jgi:glycosyltransferase involved in cell wall biosynthesis
LIVAWLVAPEGHTSALTDIVARIGDSVDCINLIWRKGRAREPWMERARNLKIAPEGNLDVSRLHKTDYCLLLKEGLVYPAGYVRRMIAAYDDIAIDRKIAGVEGVMYSDFFDGQPASRLIFKSEDPLDRHRLVNELGLEGIVFRPDDIAGFPFVDLMAPDAGLNLAVQCFRRGTPLICIARGQNWIRRHKINFGRADLSSGEGFVRDAQEIAGFGRLSVRFLDVAGHIPTYIPKIPGRPVANEEFRDVIAGVSLLERMRQIAPQWFVDFLGNSHEFAVSISQSGAGTGLAIAIDRAARALRLLAPLDPSAIGSRSLRAEIVLRGCSHEEMQPLIDGVYLVAMNADKKPEIVSRIFGSIASENSSKVFSTEIKTPRIDPQLDLFFCIQLSKDCMSIDLSSASLFEVGAPPRSKISGAPRSAAPLRKTQTHSETFRTSDRRETVSPMMLLNPKSAVIDRSSGKPRMAVICCSLGQNALGRAHTIGEVASLDFAVELLGALVPHYDRELWPPLRDTDIPIRGFAARDMGSYLSALRALPDGEPYNVVYVSKPRLHSLLLGMVLSARDKCPLILDIDDLELAFLQNQVPLNFDHLLDELRSVAAEIDNPTSEIWTRYCDTLAHEADAITVSNETLRNRFGGIVLRHARDERKFIPDESVRNRVRRSLGICDDEKVVFFLGTPRDHKGLASVAEAIVRRAEPGMTLCVMGVDNPESPQAQLARRNPAFIRTFGTQPYCRLPELIQCADAICLLQDPLSAISAFQVPAKMGEALAMGLPVLASRVAPFSDLISAGIVIPVDTDAELQIALDGLRDGRLNSAADRNKRISYFLSELSFASNAKRLREALVAASVDFPTKSAARFAVLTKLAQALRERFGVDILEFRDNGIVEARPKEAV